MKTKEEVNPNATGIHPVIANMNFDNIKWKLANAEDGAKWTAAHCDFAEVEYKKYLTLIKLYPGKALVPNKTVDKFWHQHILDTRAYAEDCCAIFGEFIHHNPYYGVGAESAQVNLKISFAETTALYEKQFGPGTLKNEASRCGGQKCHAPSKCGCRSAN